MTAGPTYLFVYGTLLSGDTGAGGRAQRGRLGRVARVLGPASVPGRLYQLGRYPGLVVDGAADGIVHGELLELTTPDTTLAWLDDYEGIVPGAHGHNEYERRKIDVTVACVGERVTAWTYVYRQPTTGKPLIVSGRWLARD